MPRGPHCSDHRDVRYPRNGEWPASWPSVEPGTVMSMALTEDSLALARVHCSVTLRGLLTINTKKRRPKP